MNNRVLVVEDDVNVASALVRGLRKAGFDVELEIDGARGLRAAARGDHDAIVLDLMLPERDGFEIDARAIRKAAASGSRSCAKARSASGGRWASRGATREASW